MYGINMDVDAKPRFDLRRYCEWSEDGDMYDICNSGFVAKLEKLPVAGEVEITVDEERLDNLSYKLYGSTQYWWILALYNFMPNFKYLRKGVIIRYFRLSDLEMMNMTLKAEA